MVWKGTGMYKTWKNSFKENYVYLILAIVAVVDCYKLLSIQIYVY